MTGGGGVIIIIIIIYRFLKRHKSLGYRGAGVMTTSAGIGVIYSAPQTP